MVLAHAGYEFILLGHLSNNSQLPVKRIEEITQKSVKFKIWLVIYRIGNLKIQIAINGLVF